MRLFQKITVTLLVTITVAAAIAIVAVALIFMPQYEQMDRNAALATAVRVNGALLREIQITTSASGDWGNWDDTRKFSMNQNKDFIETNLSPDAMTAIHSDELMIADLEGRILFQYRVPSSAGNAQVSFIRSQFIPKQHWPNKSGFKPKIKFSGLIATAEGPAIIAMTRVTDSLFTNPVERVLVLIKLLDDKVARTIQNQSGSKFILIERKHLQPNLVNTQSLHADSTLPQLKLTKTGYELIAPVASPSGDVSYDLKVGSPASYYELAVSTVSFVAGIILLIGIAAAAALVTFIRVVVTQPLTRVIEHTHAISKTGDLSKRLNFNRSDEIGTLAASYDTMLEQLNHARKQIQEMSYTSGMADTAAEMLHNIRNTLSPISTSIWKGRETLKGLKTGRLTQAADELNDPSTDDSRRAKLATFVATTSKHVDDRSRSVEAELDTIQDFTRQIESVLNQHENASRAERVSEPVQISDIIEHASKIISSSIRTPVCFTVEGDPHTAPPVLAQRILLRQVIENLAVNAVQAIEEQKPDSAQISVSIRREDQFIELAITDNGIGIQRDFIDTIFARGTSTKEKLGRGLGLHFCANSLNAMNGRISASSQGPGKGATFTIHLPASVSQEFAA